MVVAQAYGMYDEDSLKAFGSSVVLPEADAAQFIQDDVDVPKEPEERPPAIAIGAPQERTTLEIDAHELTHTPYAPWCTHCIAGRALAKRCEKIDEREGLPIVQLDYTFGRTIENEKCVPVLDAIDTTFGASCAVGYEEKGRSDAYAVKRLTRFVGLRERHHPVLPRERGEGVRGD